MSFRWHCCWFIEVRVRAVVTSDDQMVAKVGDKYEYEYGADKLTKYFREHANATGAHMFVSQRREREFWTKAFIQSLQMFGDRKPTPDSNYAVVYAEPCHRCRAPVVTCWSRKVSTRLNREFANERGKHETIARRLGLAVAVWVPGVLMGDHDYACSIECRDAALAQRGSDKLIEAVAL